MSVHVINIPIVSSKLHELETKATIVEIANASDPNQVVKPDIDDDQKRWLIVGICLHSVLSPVLRKYITPVVSQLYSKLKNSEQIDKQNYPNQLTRYKPTNKELNYEAINNNTAVPKVNRRKDEKNYNYDVTSDVDLTKLFMPTCMTHYTGFDDTCDSSALLGIIINIDTFPPIVKTVAEQVRSEIRNCWAHCNFSEWDVLKFQDSFQMLHQFIRQLKLSAQEETFALAELTRWQTNGIQFLHGTTLGMEVVKELKKEFRVISKYVLDIASHTDDGFENTQKALMNIQQSFEKIDSNCSELKENVEKLNRSIESVKTNTDQLEIKHEENKFETTSAIQNVKDDIADTKCRVSDTNIKFNECMTEIGNVKQDLRNAMKDVSRNKKEIDEIKTSQTKSRDHDKMFSYLPRRNTTFVGRNDDLEQLAERFFESRYDCNMQVICGLGGIGKTTLSIEYAWKYHTFYSGGVFWLSAETSESLEDSMQKMALDTDNVGNDVKESMRKTLMWLHGLQQRWLLVIDNLDAEEIRGNVKEFILGAWRHNSNGHIIITSRREATHAEEDFCVKEDDCITLDILTEQESLKFLTNRTGIKGDNDENVVLLSQELGGLPLALEQAAMHIKALSCSYKEYLDKFRRQRLKLLRSSRPPYELSKERQSVRTTWQLNFEYISKQSKDEGMGTAAVTVIEVLAFLYAEEIPFCVINTGEPDISKEDLLQTLKDNLGIKQIAEILTRFSLCWKNAEVLSMHRLVQEVLREDVHNAGRTNVIFQSAIRMINKALNEIPSPNEAIKEENVGKVSLYMWGKLALQANSLRTYMTEYALKYQDKEASYFNVEFTKLLQTCAIYHSFYQRQDEALACQNQMLGILTTSEISEGFFHALTSVKIPILDRERLIIQSSMTLYMDNELTTNTTENADNLRQEGNVAFNEFRFQDAIYYYSQAIRLNPENADPRLFSNRSVAFFKVGNYENSLRDANSCIELDSTIWKAYYWKALALAGLVRDGILSKSWLSVGAAIASIAKRCSKQCMNHPEFKIEYPIVEHHIAKNGYELQQLIDLTSSKNILLCKGNYNFQGAKISISRSVCILAVENDVEISNTDRLVIVGKDVDVYFENICFPSDSGSLSVGSAKTAFYRCCFKNGRKGCENFPDCDGGKGCKDKSACKSSIENAKDLDGDFQIGEVGNAGIIVFNGGKAFLDKCMFDKCGGGGILCVMENSNLEIRNSKICYNRQMGIEAREGGTIVVINCLIEGNRTHGVNIGPTAYGIVWKCQIRDNKAEGLWCGGNYDYKNMFDREANPLGRSKCIIQDNMIYQNGKSGISLEGGTYSISGNRIFDNWLWAIYAKLRSALYLTNNDIFENKCGGIKIDNNFSAPVTLDGNTIRDHNGPGIIFGKDYAAIFSEKTMKEMANSKQCLKDEVTIYNVPPVFTTRNIMRNNDRQTNIQCSHYNSKLLETCCYCRIVSSTMKNCSKCRKAGYCSKDCQRKHWNRHKHLCRLLHDKYTEEIKMENVKSSNGAYSRSCSGDTLVYETTTVPLPDLCKGTAPDLASTKKFIVKIQLQKEYTRYNPNLTLRLYDQTKTLDILFSNPTIYHFIVECGVLAGTQNTIKKLYCYASFKKNGKILCIHTETLPPYQHRW